MDKTIETQFTEQFFDVFKKVVTTEKATRNKEFFGKVTFEVSKNANKSNLKLLVEKKFNKKVKSINIFNNINGLKRAIITFQNVDDAKDVLSKMGVE